MACRRRGKQQQDDKDECCRPYKAGQSDAAAYDAGKGSGSGRRVASIEKAHQLLGFKPNTTIKEGLERTVAWICGTEHIREVIPFPRMLYRVYP